MKNKIMISLLVIVFLITDAVTLINFLMMI